MNRIAFVLILSSSVLATYGCEKKPAVTDASKAKVPQDGSEAGTQPPKESETDASKDDAAKVPKEGSEEDNALAKDLPKSYEPCVDTCRERKNTCHRYASTNDPDDRRDACQENFDKCIAVCREFLEDDISLCTEVDNDDSRKEPPAFQDKAPRPFRFTVRVCKEGTYTIPLVRPEDYDIQLPDDQEKQYRVLYDVDCDGDGTYEKTEQTGDVVCDFAPGSHRVAIRGSIPGVHFDTGELYEPELDLLHDLNMRVVSIDQWGDNAWRNLSKMFDCLPADIWVGTEAGSIKDSGSAWDGYRRYYNAKDTPNLKHVRKLSCVGGGYTDYRGSFAKWDVSNITDMSYMFAGFTVFEICMSCNALTGEFNQDISGWNTAKVQNMHAMFRGCFHFNQPIGKWNTSSVTDMGEMFVNAAEFNQPLSKWNTSKVRDMSRMFQKAYQFNQPIGTWNVSAVQNMSLMFNEANGFDQPLDKWDVSHVEDMDGMFDSASAFSHYPASWVVPKEKSEEMFEGTKVEEQAHQNPLKTR